MALINWIMDLIHLKLSTIFSLLPSNNGRKICNLVHRTSTIVCLLLICAINLYARQTTYYNHIQNLRKMVDVLIHVFTTLSNINSVVLAFLRSEVWSVLVAKTEIRNRGNVIFYALTFLYLFYGYCEISFYAKINPFIVIFLFPELVNNFLILLSILNINYFANQLKDMLVVFRQGLENEKFKLNFLAKNEANPFIVSRIFGLQSRCDYHLNYFIKICTKIDAFNKIYGWQILIFAATLLVFMYDSLNQVFTEVARSNHMSDIVPIKLFKCFSFIYGILLIRPCFKFNGEMDKIVTILRKILIDLPQTQNTDFCHHLKIKLIFLLKQIEMKKPYFTAGGFFQVNYVMLVHILNGLTSYLLVTQQAS
ncbi:gustatory receptor 86 [Tribolium castaneum]|uniref:Gustatory receptor n=1 Tax=Tribolium castaneum TaxID=7070 RepID=D6WCN9_TRICA|nr:PREDICTED: uncharacterized protein LOC107397443 isoform X3 [Tribolium castaneum]EEZ99383.1 gustatory receptor 86 [Tribolium castaneum]|eukprot:XP_015832948.1 PREDICTED: uncharacterized protein LOC107397443 isoform X3 [Tribolium castaneum]